MFQDWLASMPPEVAALLGYSRLAGAFLILLAGLVAARLIQAVVKNFLLRLARRTKSDLDEAVLSILQKPLWQTMVLFSAGLAIGWLRAGETAEYVLVGMIETAVILIWLVATLRITTIIFTELHVRLTAAGRSGADLLPLVANIVRVVLIGAAIMAVLATWEINITPLLASAGIAGVAVALAAKDTLANFFGGVSVFVDRPYKIGDYINLDSGERGEVVNIGIRSTRIQTRDDIQIIIPNAAIAAAKIINESAPEPKFRTRIKIGVAYGSDLDQVETLLYDAAATNPLVVLDPLPRVRLRTFGDSSINYELLCWLSDPRDRGRAIHEINRTIYETFGENGVSIPFPQMDVHLTVAGPDSGTPDDSE